VVLSRAQQRLSDFRVNQNQDGTRTLGCAAFAPIQFKFLSLLSAQTLLLLPKYDLVLQDELCITELET
jgi:hypothetical protein